MQIGQLFANLLQITNFREQVKRNNQNFRGEELSKSKEKKREVETFIRLSCYIYLLGEINFFLSFFSFFFLRIREPQQDQQPYIAQNSWATDILSVECALRLRNLPAT